MFYANTYLVLLAYQIIVDMYKISLLTFLRYNYYKQILSQCVKFNILRRYIFFSCVKLLLLNRSLLTLSNLYFFQKERLMTLIPEKNHANRGAKSKSKGTSGTSA